MKTEWQIRVTQSGIKLHCDMTVSALNRAQAEWIATERLRAHWRDFEGARLIVRALDVD
jgi:hypothetical protein